MNFAFESMQIVAATQTRMYIICQLHILFFWKMTIVQNDNQTDLFRMGVVQIFCATGSSFFTERPYQLYSIPIVQSGFCGKWKSQTMAAAQIGFCIKWKSYRRQFYGEINHWELLCAIV